jgi:hypothetical protein
MLFIVNETDDKVKLVSEKRADGGAVVNIMAGGTSYPVLKVQPGELVEPFSAKIPEEGIIIEKKISKFYISVKGGRTFIRQLKGTSSFEAFSIPVEELNESTRTLSRDVIVVISNKGVNVEVDSRNLAVPEIKLGLDVVNFAAFVPKYSNWSKLKFAIYIAVDGVNKYMLGSAPNKFEVRVNSIQTIKKQGSRRK